MSGNLKIIPTLIVIVIVVGGGMLYFFNSSPFSSNPSFMDNQGDITENHPGESVEEMANQNAMNDTSDVGLENDLSDIDTAMQNLDADNVIADDGLNDKAIPQDQ